MYPCTFTLHRALPHKDFWQSLSSFSYYRQGTEAGKLSIRLIHKRNHHASNIHEQFIIRVADCIHQLKTIPVSSFHFLHHHNYAKL